MGEQVVSVNHAQHTVTTDKNRIIPYDICILATGSIAALPPYITMERAKKTRGVFVYRNIADLEAIMNYAEQEGVKGGRAAVVGGGLLGLEAAKAVYDLYVLHCSTLILKTHCQPCSPTIPDVTIINRQKYPLSRQIDSDAGEMVLHAIQAMGVQVLTSVSVQEITTTRSESGDEVFIGMDLTNGTHVDAVLVIFAIGTTPRDDLAKNSGISCHARGGVVVGDDLTTSAKDVYAIGECANWRGNTYGLIGPGGRSLLASVEAHPSLSRFAVEMADILSFNLTQTTTNVGTFKPRQMNDPDLSTKLKLVGVDVSGLTCSLWRSS